MLQALTTLLTNKMVILTLFCSLVLYNPLLRAGGYGASFGIDLQDTNQINSLYFPDSLQLAIDSVRFENDIDTALNHGFLWASPSASGNLAGAMPLIKAKHNPKEFLVSFLSWNNRNTGITNRTANNITVLNINTSDNFSMQYSATAGNLLHNTDISSGNFKLTHFFFLGNSSHPAPMAMSMDNINDQYLLQWPVDNPAGIKLDGQSTSHIIGTAI
jgi:hypothetical protein